MAPLRYIILFGHGPPLQAVDYFPCNKHGEVTPKTTLLLQVVKDLATSQVPIGGPLTWQIPELKYIYSIPP